MPSWRKVILSGSDAALNSLNVSTSITASAVSASQFTGSLFGTSSWAISASRAVSSSYALTASFALNGGGGLSGNQYETVYFENTNDPAGATYVNIYPLQSEGWGFKVGRNEPTPTIPSGAHVLKDNRELFTNAKVAVQGEPFILLGFGQRNSVSLTAGDNFGHPGIDEYDGGLIPGNVYGGSLKLRKTLYGIQDADGNTKLVADGGFVVKPSSPGFLVGQGGYYIFESASMQFNASGALISPVTSASVRLGLATDSSSFTIAVGKNNLQDILFISRSGADARIAVGGNYRTPRNTLDISGSLRVFTSITASTVSASGVISSSNLSIIGFPNVSASLASLASGVGTLQQVTDAGNTTSNVISSSFAGVGFYGTASWAINVVNGGGGGGGGSDSAFLNQSTAATTWSFAHNLGTQYPVITVYDTNGQVIIPQEIDGEDTNNLKIYFPTSQSGYATAVGGTSALTYYSQSLTTASVNLNTITFTKGDSTQFNITVNTGSGGGGGSDFPYTGSAIISGSLTVTGSVISTGGFTGSLFGTSSWAINALTAALAPNYVLNSQTSSMLAPYVLNSQTSSFVLNSQTSSMLAPYVLNSQTSSFVLNSQTSSMTVLSSSFASTASFINNLNQNLSITGAVILSGSFLPELRVIGETQFTGSVGSTGGFTGSLLGTSSWASNAITASYILNAISSSFASTASYVLNAVSSSFSSTASFTPNAITTASVNLNTITFTKGSGTTFNITVDTGSGGGGGSVTINNNVDNYLITATGTANTLNGEVDLQYSSSILINRGRSLFTYSGLGVTNTTHYFRATGSDINAGFLVADKEGEDLFKVAGSIADSDSLITIGDVGNAANATKIEVNDATNYINLQGVTRANQIATEATALSAAGEFDIGSRIAREWSTTGPALIAGRIVYLSGSTEWAQAQANASGSSYGMLGVVINTESQREILIEGTIRVSGSALSSGVVGQPVYLSAATAGQVSLTAPSTSGQVVRIVGYVYRASGNVMYFRPDTSYAIVT